MGASNSLRFAFKGAIPRVTGLGSSLSSVSDQQKKYLINRQKLPSSFHKAWVPAVNNVIFKSVKITSQHFHAIKTKNKK